MTTNERVDRLRDSLVAFACAFEALSVSMREMAEMVDGVDWSKVETRSPRGEGEEEPERVEGGSLDDDVWYRCGFCGNVSQSFRCPRGCEDGHE